MNLFSTPTYEEVRQRQLTEAKFKLLEYKAVVEDYTASILALEKRILRLTGEIDEESNKANASRSTDSLLPSHHGL